MANDFSQKYDSIAKVRSLPGFFQENRVEVIFNHQ